MKPQNQNKLLLPACQGFPSGLVGNKKNVNEGFINDAAFLIRIMFLFLGYVEKKVRKWIILQHKERAERLLIRVWSKSRYSEEGLRKKKKELKKLPRKRKCVMITLTFDRKRHSLIEACAIVGKEIRRFLNSLNEWRKRRGFRKRLGYCWVIEFHRDLYPHVHIIFPGLKYVAPKEVIEKLWGKGFTRVEQQRVDVAGYLVGYVSKAEKKYGIAEKALLWFFGIRIHDRSKSLVKRMWKNEEKEREWIYLGCIELEDVWDYVEICKKFGEVERLKICW